MNFKTFLAMLARDAHVARRNTLTLAFQVLLQPMMVVFVFGRVMTVSGLMSMEYKALLLPGRPHVSSGCRGTKEISSILQIRMRRNNSTSQHSAQRRANA